MAARMQRLGQGAIQLACRLRFDRDLQEWVIFYSAMGAIMVVCRLGWMAHGGGQ